MALTRRDVVVGALAGGAALLAGGVRTAGFADQLTRRLGRHGYIEVSFDSTGAPVDTSTHFGVSY